MVSGSTIAIIGGGVVILAVIIIIIVITVIYYFTSGDQSKSVKQIDEVEDNSEEEYLEDIETTTPTQQVILPNGNGTLQTSVTPSTQQTIDQQIAQQNLLQKTENVEIQKAIVQEQANTLNVSQEEAKKIQSQLNELTYQQQEEESMLQKQQLLAAQEQIKLKIQQEEEVLAQEEKQLQLDLQSQIDAQNAAKSAQLKAAQEELLQEEAVAQQAAAQQAAAQQAAAQLAAQQAAAQLAAQQAAAQEEAQQAAQLAAQQAAQLAAQQAAAQEAAAQQSTTLSGNTNLPAFPNYNIIYGSDITGNDIRKAVTDKQFPNNLSDFKTQCDVTPNCVAFNINGWLKSATQPVVPHAGSKLWIKQTPT